MWKIFKIILIVFLVIILLLALLISFAYVKNEITNKNIDKWTYCEVDEDCVLIKSYKPCACGSFSVNKMYEDKYIPFMEKVVKKRVNSKFQMMCEMCMPLHDEIPKCVKNKCYAYSDNNNDLKLLNMT
jgi:hypothetical protein